MPLHGSHALVTAAWVCCARILRTHARDAGAGASTTLQRGGDLYVVAQAACTNFQHEKYYILTITTRGKYGR